MRRPYENQECDKVKAAFEKTHDKYEVLAVGDLGGGSYFVSCKIRGGKTVIPAPMFKVNAKSGASEKYFPMADLDAFTKANLRTKVYKKG